jgi:hypothetical protein
MRDPSEVTATDHNVPPCPFNFRVIHPDAMSI